VRIAFYAPMKPPDHPVPSGDRRMARAFADLLGMLGHEVRLACRLVTRDGGGDDTFQRRIGVLGATAARLLLARWQRAPESRPELWFTYHLYHKAPDPLGWRVADALGIPYVVAEASVSKRQATGPWATGFRLSLEALARADAILAMTRHDLGGLEESFGPDPRLRLFPPFLDPEPFARVAVDRARHREMCARIFALDPGVPWLLAIAMMRAGAKLRSYRFLAEALACLEDRPWQLLLVGSGAAEAEVRRAFARFGSRVRLPGRLAPEELPALCAACDLYLWPGFGEAYGMSYLEAQAAGLPVVALDGPGVRDVVADGEGGVRVREATPDAYAAAVEALLDDAAWRRELSRRARDRVCREHGIGAAAERMRGILDRVVQRRAAGGGATGEASCRAP